MAKQIAFTNDDYELDDAVLWAAIDSAAASLSSRTTTPTAKPRAQPFTPIPFPLNSPQSKSTPNRSDNNYYPDGEVLQNDRPNKIAKMSGSSFSSPSGQMVVVKNGGRSPFVSPVYETKRDCSVGSYCSAKAIETEHRHSLAGQFPTVSLFKEYQNAAMAILEKGDYTMISGHPYIKKTGWRKISFYFNLSYEIRDKIIEFDDNRNVQRAEFTVRAYMQGGRFSDGWGSCDRREKKFMKPNHDIPSTAETRAKNKACQDLLGIGEYRANAGHT